MIDAEDALVTRACSGDRAAFGELYQNYYPQLLNFCRTRTASLQDAEDLASDTFSKALSKIEQYQARGHRFSSFLYSVARNASVDLARKQTRATLRLNSNDIAIDDLTSYEAIQGDQSARLHARINELPGIQRQVVNMRFLEDRSTKDIADTLNRPVGAIRSLQFRALGSLRPLSVNLQ